MGIGWYSKLKYRHHIASVNILLGQPWLNGSVSFKTMRNNKGEDRKAPSWVQRAPAPWRWQCSWFCGLSRWTECDRSIHRCGPVIESHWVNWCHRGVVLVVVGAGDGFSDRWVNDGRSSRLLRRIFHSCCMHVVSLSSLHSLTHQLARRIYVACLWTWTAGGFVCTLLYVNDRRWTAYSAPGWSSAVWWS